MPHIDFGAVDTPRFTRPELLQHHTIPPPLFGLAPRYIKGQEWWDKTRRAAYEANNMRCWACGGPGPLQAHEAYTIDRRTGRMTYVETVSLCVDCHSFIHIGRTLGIFVAGGMKSSDVKRIVLNGYKVLKDAGLKCPWETNAIADPTLPWKGSTTWIKRVVRNTAPKPETWQLSWDDYRLVLDGVEYPPRYKSLDDFKQNALQGDL